jgi:hypothetical protein
MMVIDARALYGAERFAGEIQGTSKKMLPLLDDYSQSKKSVLQEH